MDSTSLELLPEFMLYAEDYSQLSKVTQVFNSKSWSYYLWVKLPEHISKKFQLYQVDEWQQSQSEIRTIDITDCWTRDGYHPWIKFVSGIFNKQPGIHTYVLRFVDVTTHDIYNLYIRYIQQVDDPDKSYLYMD